MSVHTHGIDEVSFDINTEPLVFTSEPTPGLDDHDLADVQLAPLRNSLTSPKSCLNSPEQPFPSLPVEIIIQILDLTASLSRRSASSISSVSTWARELALPYLFSTIIHRATPSIFAGITSVNSLLQYRSSQAKTPEKCGRYVRNLWIESIGIGTPSSEVDTLRSCPNVENLALPSASLRVLYTAIQIAAAEKYQPSQPQTQFLGRLYSITLITHTFRYDWHILIRVYLSNGKPLLDAITRLRILDMKISGYVPYLLSQT
ncbi:hypothetical protein A0H81_03914 [Grifola frondosa]|uniref:Uncharacterized protein n=1 Tax=Grifola frondosa TaxID=5627 RepID=A0A1C7MIJ4_GRIFR|nr:hypothetical protein A0H81_03914 [Grifola frondosa]